jgi:hypothetical protein
MDETQRKKLTPFWWTVRFIVCTAVIVGGLWLCSRFGYN